MAGLEDVFKGVVIDSSCPRGPARARDGIEEVLNTFHRSPGWRFKRVCGDADDAVLRVLEAGHGVVADYQEHLKQERLRREAQAKEQSRQQLLQVIERCSFAQNVARFLRELEVEISRLDPEARPAFEARLSLAKQVVGETSATSFFSQWRTPEELISRIA